MDAHALRLKRVEQLVGIVSDYLHSRFEMATRFSPPLKSVREDAIWLQLRVLRHVLVSFRSFGPEKLHVIDIMSGEDETKRLTLFTHTNQNQIYSEIIQKKEEGKKGLGGLDIKDIGSLLRVIEPSMERLIELIQNWIWWDLRDAVDLRNADEKLQRIQSLAKAEINEPMKDYYRSEMKMSAGQEIGKPQILGFEVGRYEETVQHFMQFRQEEPTFRVILRYETHEGEDQALNGLILKMSHRLLVLERLHKGETLDPQVLQAYSQITGLPKEELSSERLQALIRKMVADEARELRQILESEAQAGERYDYKARQASELQRKLLGLKKALGLAPQGQKAA
ncbi:MAG: hypothetical protein V2A74_07895 [bacterium]